jgi:hypothetical protein
MNLTTRNQQFAALSAAIYLVSGLIGFAVTGFDDFFGDTDEKLIILGLNPMHNIVHLVLGAAWLVAARDAATAKMANIALGVGLLVAFVLGVVGGLGFLNIDNAAEPDNYLHLIYGFASLFIGMKVEDEVSVGATARAAL